MRCRRHTGSIIAALSGLAAALFQCGTTFAAQSAPDSPPEAEGVTFDAAMGTYSVQRVPARTLEAVMKSFADWQHQVLADESTANFVAEDGILSMECSACGLTRPSAIDIATIDLKTLVAYEAGTWHLGVRSQDGAQDFFGVLRGELGSGPHDPARVAHNKRIALIALRDLHDLVYLTQNPGPAATLSKGGGAAEGGASKARVPAAGPGRASQSAPAVATATKSAPKPGAISLAALASSGDVEGIQAQRGGKVSAREMGTALETAFGARARSQMLEGEVDTALQTLSVARQKFGKSTALRDREASYVVIGDAYDRLRLAVKLDVAGLRSFLQQIQTLEPADATPIEQMLARTLSHRIADQRAAGRTTVADDLLTSGRDLFPLWADLLIRGDSGALPQSGVEVGTAATTTGNSLP